MSSPRKSESNSESAIQRINQRYPNGERRVQKDLAKIPIRRWMVRWIHVPKFRGQFVICKFMLLFMYPYYLYYSLQTMKSFQRKKSYVLISLTACVIFFSAFFFFNRCLSLCTSLCIPSPDSLSYIENTLCERKYSGRENI